MKLSQKELEEIAEWTLMGELCYVHKTTGELVHFPDPDLIEEMELWEDTINPIRKNAEQYVLIDNMDSNAAFAVMEEFVESLPLSQSKGRLISALAGPKPFRYFKFQVDDTEFRQDWFEFRLKANAEWVRKQLSSKEDD